MDLLTGLAPILPAAPTLLLLGSMPGAASLEKGQYYGHPQNHFWQLMSHVLHEEPPPDYPARVDMLVRHNIALWDSIHTCRRDGSLDKNIRDAQPNDIGGLLARTPSLRAVAFNGTLSERVYDRYFRRLPHLTYMRLPSSSPVPSRTYRTMAHKLEAWLALRAYIGRHTTAIQE